MKVALLGATGFVGAALLEELIRRGHAVTAILRHPEKLQGRENVTPVRGDVYDTDGLANVLRGHEALISAFNPGWKNPDLYEDQVRGTATILSAVRMAGVTRVLWVGGAGGLTTPNGTRVLDNPNFPEAIRPGAMATLNAFEQLQNEPGLDWTYLAPSARLERGSRTGHFRLGGDDLLVDANGDSHISVQDYAVAMVDELEQPAHMRQRFTVGY
jgi:putative NADH-flavin reductase